MAKTAPDEPRRHPDGEASRPEAQGDRPSLPAPPGDPQPARTRLRGDPEPARAQFPDESPRRATPPDLDATVTAPAEAHTPEWIAEFRIVRRLGQGGMGVVYEAEQQNPKRPVALKLIRGGSVDDTHLRMFRREVQTLARLKHPGIAAIYESGRTPDGQHFFAMELVRGETLGEHLKKRQGADGALPAAEVKERLALFCKICDAISYAHQRGVIHRDLKPANILVLRDTVTSSSASASGPPVPDIKILDFGLARITDSDVAVSTVLTDLGSVQGTLPYMSPEQVRGNPDEIDLRSDVYSLGVLLYEILTGRLPLEVGRAPLPEAVRRICEESPLALTRTWKGARKLDADLATIVHKALEKEPARRYQSAAALAEDIQRYLTDQPILARPPSAAYQLRKLVARHRAPFAFAASLVVLLLALAVTMAVQAGRIARERDRANREAETAREVSEFLVNLFQVSDPSEARGNTITARELLDQGAARIEHELTEQPLMQAQLMHTMGKVYNSLALPAQAEPLLSKAVAIRRRELGEDHPELAHSLIELGNASAGLGKTAQAQALYERALAILERHYGPDHAEVGMALYALRGVYWQRDNARAQAILERALRIFEKDPVANWRGLSWCLNDLGGIRQFDHDYAGALRYFQQALEIKERALPADDPDVAITLGAIGYLQVQSGDYDAAQPSLERSLAIFERTLGPQHPWTANGLQSLGELWWRKGDLARAKQLLERAVAILPEDHYVLPLAMHTLACVLRDLNEQAESEALFRRALALRDKALGPEHADVGETLKEYSILLRRMKRDREAQVMETRARAILDKASPARP